jgi:hypothetical protein
VILLEYETYIKTKPSVPAVNSRRDSNLKLVPWHVFYDFEQISATSFLKFIAKFSSLAYILSEISESVV